jgi:hypothetical protein
LSFAAFFISNGHLLLVHILPAAAYQSLLELAHSMGATVKLWSMEIQQTTGEPYFRYEDRAELVDNYLNR